MTHVQWKQSLTQINVNAHDIPKCQIKTRADAKNAVVYNLAKKSFPCHNASRSPYKHRYRQLIGSLQDVLICFCYIYIFISNNRQLRWERWQHCEGKPCISSLRMTSLLPERIVKAFPLRAGVFARVLWPSSFLWIDCRFLSANDGSPLYISTRSARKRVNSQTRVSRCFALPIRRVLSAFPHPAF